MLKVLYFALGGAIYLAGCWSIGDTLTYRYAVFTLVFLIFTALVIEE